MEISREQRLEQALRDLIRVTRNYKVGQIQEKLYKVENKAYRNAEVALNKSFDISNLERGKVDLRTCNGGDILISALGAVLEYVSPTTEGQYLDHVVKYLDANLGLGTRTHDGYVFLRSRNPETDHDIVKIIPKQSRELLWKD